MSLVHAVTKATRSSCRADGSSALVDVAVGPVALSRKAQLRQVAVRDYARLRLHARNCTDCQPGSAEIDPPRINRGCRVGMVGKVEYERSYRAWVDCPEEDVA